MIPDYYEFRSATKILSGENAIEHIPYELANLGVTRAMIVTDALVRQLGLVQPVVEALLDSDIELGTVFDDVPVDSSVEVCNRLADIYRDHRCDGLVAIGGGSVLDTAKGVAIVLAGGSADLMELRGSEILMHPKMPPFLAVPTTAGTGSEVTGAAVIKDIERNVKMAFVSFDLAPHVAVLDPRMTVGLPARLTASTAMDALVHAIEAASGRQRNPLSDAYAYAAIALVRENLAAVIADGRDTKARLALANAALMSGIAFSNSMVGIVHALGHACGALAHVPHGDAMAILLPHCMRFNLEVAGPAYAELLLPLAGADVYAATPPEMRATAAIVAAFDLLAIAAAAGVPVSLSEAGVTEELLPRIAASALDDGSMGMTPKPADLDDTLAILRAAM